mmetsp:Transcript_24794/g.73347  ORF Transcript_24794/g.73347 Transcript_24794/m.73347 type:complete len:236 (+) Transcript_24794:804-1511(+)
MHEEVDEKKHAQERRQQQVDDGGGAEARLQAARVGHKLGPQCVARLIKHVAEHCPAQVPLQRLGQQRAAAAEAEPARERHGRREHALVDHCDEVIVLAHDAADDVVLVEVALRTQRRCALHQHDAVHHLRPDHGADLALADAERVAEEVARLRHLLELHCKVHEGPHPVQPKDGEVHDDEQHGQHAAATQRLPVDCHACNVACVLYDAVRMQRPPVDKQQQESRECHRESQRQHI